jgi:VWFA-related protein
MNTYGRRGATLLQGCLILVLFPQPSLPQSQPAPQPALSDSESKAPQSGSFPPSVRGVNRPVTLIPRSAQDRERASQAARHIILNVFVADASGNPVTSLKQEDFTLLDNQRPQKIVSFKAAAGSTVMTPPHIMLMLDSVNNSSHAVAYARDGLEKFLGENRGSLRYPVSIVRLTDSGISVGEPSLDGNALIRDLRMLPDDIQVKRPDQESSANPIVGDASSMLVTLGAVVPFSPPQTMNPLNPVIQDLNHRFTLSIPALADLAVQQEDVAGRVILVWIGAGWPLLSGPDFLPDTPEIKSNFFGFIVILANELRKAQITLDAVSSPKMMHAAKLKLRPDYYQPFLNGVTTFDQATSGNLALPVLAYQSGGQILVESEDLAADIDKCIADAGSYYVLSFDSTAGNPDEYHSLQVKVNKSGLTVRTNRSYYAEP